VGVRTEAVKLSRLIPPERVLLASGVSDKWSLIESLVGLVTRSMDGQDVRHRAVLQAVVERERSMSTAFDQGLAVPHGLVSVPIPPCGALAVCSDGVDFESLDGAPTHFVLLLVLEDGDASRRLHLTLLARAARLFSQMSFREGLLRAGSSEDAHEHLQRAEAGLD